MDSFEEKLDSILKNPQMMEQIMSMAQSLGGNNPSPQQNENTSLHQPQNDSMVDFSLLQKFAGLSGQSSIDQDQKQLLQALVPYLSKNHVSKLENAMRAAKLAKIASSFLGNGGIQLTSGR